MSTVILECWWRLIDILDLKETLRLAALLECQIFIPSVRPYVRTDEEGYQLLRVFFSSDVEVFLLTLANTANLYGHLDIRECRPISPPAVRRMPEFFLFIADSVCRHNHERQYGFPRYKHIQYEGYTLDDF